MGFSHVRLKLPEQNAFDAQHFIKIYNISELKYKS